MTKNEMLLSIDEGAKTDEHKIISNFYLVTYKNNSINENLFGTGLEHMFEFIIS